MEILKRQDQISQKKILTPDEEKIFAFKAEILERFSKICNHFSEALKKIHAYVTDIVDNLQNTMQGMAESADGYSAGNRLNHKDQTRLLGLVNEAKELLDRMSIQIQLISKEGEDAIKSSSEEIFADITQSFDKMDEIIERLTYDGRFLSENLHIFGKGFSRFFSKTKVEEIIQNYLEDKINDIVLESQAASCFLVYIDVDGLKPINDFAGHENGTNYLRQIVQTLLHDKDIADFAEKNSLQLHCSAEGGDEFAVWGEKMDGPTDPELRQELVQLIKNRIENIDMSSIINFNDDEVQDNLDNTGISLPRDAKITASASAYCLGLNEAISLALDHANERGIDLIKQDIRQIVKMILGQLFGKCDLGMRRDKIKNYRDMQHSNDARQRNLYLLIQKSGRSDNGSLRPDIEQELAEVLELQKELEDISADLVRSKDKNIAYAKALSAIKTEEEDTIEQNKQKEIERIQNEISGAIETLKDLNENAQDLNTLIAEDPKNTALKRLAARNNAAIEKFGQKRKKLQDELDAILKK